MQNTAYRLVEYKIIENEHGDGDLCIQDRQAIYWQMDPIQRSTCPLLHLVSTSILNESSEGTI